jgi:preprotein translocase subunit SecA
MSNRQILHWPRKTIAIGIIACLLADSVPAAAFLLPSFRPLSSSPYSKIFQQEALISRMVGAYTYDEKTPAISVRQTGFRLLRNVRENFQEMPLLWKIVTPILAFLNFYAWWYADPGGLLMMAGTPWILSHGFQRPADGPPLMRSDFKTAVRDALPNFKGVVFLRKIARLTNLPPDFFRDDRTLRAVVHRLVGEENKRRAGMGRDPLFLTIEAGINYLLTLAEIPSEKEAAQRLDLHRTALRHHQYKEKAEAERIRRLKEAPVAEGLLPRKVIRVNVPWEHAVIEKKAIKKGVEGVLRLKAAIQREAEAALIVRKAVEAVAPLRQSNASESDRKGPPGALTALREAFAALQALKYPQSDIVEYAQISKYSVSRFSLGSWPDAETMIQLADGMDQLLQKKPTLERLLAELSLELPHLQLGLGDDSLLLARLAEETGHSERVILRVLTFPSKEVGHSLVQEVLAAARRLRESPVVQRVPSDIQRQVLKKTVDILVELKFHMRPLQEDAKPGASLSGEFAALIPPLDEEPGTAKTKVLEPGPQVLESAERVERLRNEWRYWTADRLAERAAQLRKRRRVEGPSRALSEEAVAVFALMSKHVLREDPTATQVIAALVMLEGPTAVEQDAGDGKTLSIAMAAYVSALSGRGVHIHTFNRYLAGRDMDKMGKVYRRLGLTTGLLNPDLPKEQHIAYTRDITYGAYADFITDSLSDELAPPARRFQRAEPPEAIYVDEADVPLFDEARHLVVLSSPAQSRFSLSYLKAVYGFTGIFQEDVDYTLHPGDKSARLTEEGLLKVKGASAFSRFLVPEEDLLDHIQEAIAARTLYRRDIDYVIMGGQVLLLDHVTHRIRAGSVWEGQMNNFVALHEQAKNESAGLIEGAAASNLTTVQAYYVQRASLLRTVSATLAEAADELKETYNLSLVLVRRESAPERDDEPSELFVFHSQKGKASRKAFERLHAVHTPLMIVSNLLDARALFEKIRRGVPHVRKLTVFEEAEEREILSGAGQPDAVTVASGMVGRGTDVRTGGRVFAVMGMEPPLTARAERQLRRRAGRWTDPGRSLMFGSLEDDLFRIYLSAKQRSAIAWLADVNGKIPPAVAEQALAIARAAVETHDRAARDETRKQGELLSDQRRAFFAHRDASGLPAVTDQLHALWRSFVGDLQTWRRRLSFEDYQTRSLQRFQRLLLEMEEVTRKGRSDTGPGSWAALPPEERVRRTVAENPSWTQKQIAKYTGLPPITVSRLIRDHNIAFHSKRPRASQTRVSAAAAAAAGLLILLLPDALFASNGSLSAAPGLGAGLIIALVVPLFLSPEVRAGVYRGAHAVLRAA